MERKTGMRYFSILVEGIPRIELKQLNRGFVDQTVSALSACIRAAFFLSGEIRRNTVVYILVKREGYTFKLVGSELKYLGPDTRSIAILLMRTQRELNKLNKRREIRSRRGVYICENSDMVETLRRIATNQIIFPTTSGEAIEKIKLGRNVNVIIPIRYPFTISERNKLFGQGYKGVFFRDIYTVDNFIVMVHNRLDSLWSNDSDGDN
ncbi:MAG: hypothetical protein Q6352_012585 [Candidatus Freyrarchaeum guaymaensis]